MQDKNAKSSQRDFLANLIPLPGSEEAIATTVRSGTSLCDSLESAGHVGRLARTFMGSLRWGSMICYLTWKTSPIGSRYFLFRLAPSMPPTDETGYGLLPTKTAQPYGRNKSPTPGAQERRSLEQLASRGLLHTPTKKANQLSPTMKRWPGNWFLTPSANEDAAGTPNGNMQKMLGNSVEVRGETEEEWNSGVLNPDWVEWLMGYPSGWTDLEDSETP